MAKHSVKRKKTVAAFSFWHALILCICVVCICFGLFLWKAAFTPSPSTPTVDDDDFRPVIGEPPYRIAVDAGHGGSDPGARESFRKAK